jgi:hypothetical protein
MVSLLVKCLGVVSLFISPTQKNFKRLVIISAIESSCISTVSSSAGAIGIAQIMPKTGEFLWKSCKKNGVFFLTGLYDTKTNLDLANCYINQLADRYGGDINMILAHYNGGFSQPKRLAKGLSLYSETANYLAKYNYLERTHYENAYRNFIKSSTNKNSYRKTNKHVSRKKSSN